MHASFVINYIQGWSPGKTGVTLVGDHLAAELSLLHRQTNVFRYRLAFFPPRVRLLYQSKIFPLRIKTFDRSPAVHILGNQTLAGLLSDLRYPSIVIVHDLIQVEEMPPSGLLHRHVNHWLQSLSLAAGIMTNSDYTKQCIMRKTGISPERIHAIHLGVDHKVFQPLNPDRRNLFLTRHGLKQDKRYLLYVGSEQPRKNFKAALRILHDVSSVHPDVALIKIGTHQCPEERGANIEEARRLGVLESLHILEGLGDDEVAMAYNASCVLLFPSLNEGFGLPLLEAMACGLPVVASRSTSVPEVLGGAGIMHDPTEVGAMADSVKSLLASEQLHRELSNRGIERANGFSWQKCAKELYELIEQIALGRH